MVLWLPIICRVSVIGAWCLPIKSKRTKKYWLDYQKTLHRYWLCPTGHTWAKLAEVSHTVVLCNNIRRKVCKCIYKESKCTGISWTVEHTWCRKHTSQGRYLQGWALISRQRQTSAVGGAGRVIDRRTGSKYPGGGEIRLIGQTGNNGRSQLVGGREGGQEGLAGRSRDRQRTRVSVLSMSHRNSDNSWTELGFGQGLS